MTAGVEQTATLPAVAAMGAERLHSMLRAMADEDWVRLKALMVASLSHSGKEQEIDVLERMFRKGEAIARQAGGTVLRLIEAITGDPLLLDEVRRANERAKARVRFVLREMSDEGWEQFKLKLQAQLDLERSTDELVLLELVFRTGESVSNVEVAAQAKSDQVSGKKLLAPEVARKNALMRASAARHPVVDPDAAYEAAKDALHNAEETARRAAHTLACSYVQPTAAFKHARNTVFRLVDLILDDIELMREVMRLDRELASVPQITREQLRWALHRMPLPARFQVLQLIPLNTILMFQTDGDRAQMATRDRRLAHDLFVNGQSDEELAEAYNFSVNAVKNAVGTILHALMERPMARKLALEYLQRTAKSEPMASAEVRRRMKHLSSEQRAEIVHAIPNCAWKVRTVSHLHKHLFLDYFSGEWVMATLVQYYNQHKAGTLARRGQLGGVLTLRGATAALEGIIHKISEEPELCEKLRGWTSGSSLAAGKTARAPLSGLDPGTKQTRAASMSVVELEAAGAAHY
jgi:hypothetical protein